MKFHPSSKRYSKAFFNFCTKKTILDSIDIENDLQILVGLQNDWKILKDKNFKDPKTISFKN